MLIGGLALPSQAHEIRPAIADITITETELELQIRTPLEPLIAGMPLDSLENTNDSPLAGYHDRLRAMPPDELRQVFETSWEQLSTLILLQAGDTRLTLELVGVNIPEVGDAEFARDSQIILRSDLPDDGTDVIFGWSARLGAIVLRQQQGEEIYAAILAPGELSEPLPRGAVLEQSASEVFLTYLISGFDHILPKGLDHILFVLGLFFFALAWGPLLWQVSAFTLAHTITLALATLGVVTVAPDIVEPLIAASIAYIAAENVFGSGQINVRRVALIFGFGLLHGLGFATVLGDFGLEQGQFILSLIAFNIGVELGQIAVLILAFLTVGLWFGSKPWYRGYIAVPASVIIGCIGLYWTIERTLL